MRTVFKKNADSFKKMRTLAWVRILVPGHGEIWTVNFSHDLEHQNKLMRTEVNFLMIRRTSKGVYRPCRITCPLTTCFTEPIYQTTELDALS